MTPFKRTLLSLAVILLVGAAFLQLHSGAPAPYASTKRAPQPVDVYLTEYTVPSATSLGAMVSGVPPLTISPPKTVSYQGNTVLYVIVRGGPQDYLRVEGRQISHVVNREGGKQVIRADAITDPEQQQELAQLLSTNAPAHDVRFRDPE
jgi:hypothetical protein